MKEIIAVIMADKNNRIGMLSSKNSLNWNMLRNTVKKPVSTDNELASGPLTNNLSLEKSPWQEPTIPVTSIAATAAPRV